MITSVEKEKNHGMPIYMHEATDKFGGSLLDLRCRWLVLGRFNFFTRLLAGLNQSSIHAKFRQNDRLKQKPDDQQHNYPEQIIHGIIPHLSLKSFGY